MNEATVYAPVAVLERMYIHEAEGRRGRLKNRIDAVLPHAVVSF